MRPASEYSRDELKEALASIDASRYPDRANELKEELAKRPPPSSGKRVRKLGPAMHEAVTSARQDLKKRRRRMLIAGWITMLAAIICMTTLRPWAARAFGGGDERLTAMMFLIPVIISPLFLPFVFSLMSFRCPMCRQSYFAPFTLRSGKRTDCSSCGFDVLNYDPDTDE